MLKNKRADELVYTYQPSFSNKPHLHPRYYYSDHACQALWLSITIILTPVNWRKVIKGSGKGGVNFLGYVLSRTMGKVGEGGLTLHAFFYKNGVFLSEPQYS